MKNGHGRSGWVARLGKVPLLWLALAASGPLAGCSREPSSHGDVEPAGSIGLNLTAAPGVTLNAVTYTITGNGFTKTGAIDTSGAPTISGTIGGIPAGKGYTITLTATSVEGDTTFTGSATFDVTAGATTSVTVRLNGTGKTGNGSVAVNGTINVNPRIDEVTVTPQTVFVGSSIKLFGGRHRSRRGAVAAHLLLVDHRRRHRQPDRTERDADQRDARHLHDQADRLGRGRDRHRDHDGHVRQAVAAARRRRRRRRSAATAARAEQAQHPADHRRRSGRRGHQPLSRPRGHEGPGADPEHRGARTERHRVRQRLGEPGVLADPRHHRERPVRLSHRRDDRGQRAADLDRHALRSPHGREPDLHARLLRQVPPRRWNPGIDPRPGDRVPGRPRRILQHVRDLGITTYRGILGGGLDRLLQLDDVRHQRARRSPTRRTRRPP